MSIEHDKLQILSDTLDNKYDFLGKRPKKPKTYTITVLGDKGTGKTLLLAIFCCIYETLGIYYYTNFSLHPSFIYRKPFDIKALYGNPDVEGIFLDECHNIADQNSNHTLETQLLVALFTQSRKRNQLIFMTSLRFYKLAKDLRYLTDIILYPNYNEYDDTLTLEFIDIKTDMGFTEEISNVSRFFNIYDTTEIIYSGKIKTQLKQYLLQKKRIEKEVEKELDVNDKKLIMGLEDV